MQAAGAGVLGGVGGDGLTLPNLPTIISDEYDLLAAIKAVEGQAEPILEHEYLNFKADETRQCRFCPNTDSQLFQNKSHTFPQGLGNRWHISWDECDNCNKHFADFDANLCSALGIMLTHLGIKGKNGVRSTGRMNGKHIVRHTKAQGIETVSTILLDGESGIMPSAGVQFVFNADTGIHNMPTPDEKFTPRKAFKALMKIGFAILPASELKNFQRLREWIKSTDDELEFPFLKVSIAFDEVINAPKVWSATLFRRRPEIHNVPYCRIVLTVGPVCILADLMPDSLDDGIGLQYLTTKERILEFAFELADSSFARLHFKYFKSLDWSSSSRVETPIANMVFMTDRDGKPISISPRLRS